jgi:hypothetical protein
MDQLDSEPITVYINSLAKSSLKSVQNNTIHQVILQIIQIRFESQLEMTMADMTILFSIADSSSSGASHVEKSIYYSSHEDNIHSLQKFCQLIDQRLAIHLLALVVHTNSVELTVQNLYFLVNSFRFALNYSIQLVLF